ncbi:MAG: hypothetical protein NZ938_04460 [Aigarchaeota archaeon]|nr:hypothetical protein [Candidatus Calditenuaceae archaeon]
MRLRATKIRIKTIKDHYYVYIGPRSETYLGSAGDVDTWQTVLFMIREDVKDFRAWLMTKLLINAAIGLNKVKFKEFLWRNRIPKWCIGFWNLVHNIEDNSVDELFNKLNFEWGIYHEEVISYLKKLKLIQSKNK